MQKQDVLDALKENKVVFPSCLTILKEPIGIRKKMGSFAILSAPDVTLGPNPQPMPNVPPDMRLAALDIVSLEAPAVEFAIHKASIFIYSKGEITLWFGVGIGEEVREHVAS